MHTLRNTRERIITVARGVFANLSPAKTTMDDIAGELKMGRRTIYSYFDSKEALYTEVVNLEIRGIIEKLTAVSESEGLSEEKLHIFVRRRMKAVKDIYFRNPAVRNDFNHNPTRIEQLRKTLDEGEIVLLAEILNDGVRRGEFQITDVQLTAYTMQKTLKSLEIPMIKDGFENWSKRIIENFITTLLNGIKRNKQECI